MKHIIILLLITYIVSSNQIRGINPLNEHQYTSNKFTCFDSSKTIDITAVNDDYCDCADGSDEPGTSACPNGKFYCLNRGHVPTTITSSRVLDGVCDCCDGSDEYDEHTQSSACKDTCNEEAAEAKKVLLVELEKHEEGVRKKLEFKATHDNLVIEKTAAKAELEEEANQLKTLQSEVRSKKEELEKRIDDKKQSLRELLLPDVEKQITEDEKLQPIESQPTQDGIYKEETAEGETAPETTQEPTETREQKIEKLLSEKVDQNPDLIALNEELKKIDEELSSVSNDLRDCEKDLEETNKFLSVDFGLDSSYGYLYNQKIDLNVGEYRYELHPFKDVKQVGGSTHTLGRWTAWSDDTQRVMKYEGGDRCWGGPDRSVHISLSCGTETKLLEVKEPAKCEYAMFLETPGACSQQALDDLRLRSSSP